MFYYDQDGELRTSGDAEVRNRHHTLKILEASNYGLRPEVAGRLDRILGRIDPEASKQQAERQVRKALLSSGLGNVEFEVSIDPAQKQWQLNLDVGSTT
jgi:hypothetical protein